MPARVQYDEIPLDSIVVSPANVRKSDLEEGIQELADSIQEIELQQPVVVYRKGKTYQLIIGRRRYMACKRLGLKKIPALIRSVKDETEAAIISFSENIHRLDMSYRDKMSVAVRLLEDLKSVRAVAKRLGISDQSVRNYLGYAGVPERLKRMVDAGKIGATTAMNIATSIGDEERAVRIAQKVAETRSDDRRRKIVEAARENPDQSPDEIAKFVARIRYSDITLHLTPRVAAALEDACRDYNLEPDVVAKYALEEWLGKRGFLK